MATQRRGSHHDSSEASRGPQGADEDCETPLIRSDKPGKELSDVPAPARMTEDEAWLNSKPWWKYWPCRWKIVVFALTADLVCYMDRANISVAMLPMAQEYGWDKDFQAFFVGLFTSHIIGGHIADVYGAKIVLTMGVLWWSIFTTITPLAAPWKWAVLLARFGLGFGEGVCFPCLFNLFAHWFPIGEKTIYVSIAQNGVYIGTVLAMLAVPPIENGLGWEWAFYIFGSVGILWSVLFCIYGHSRPALDPAIDPHELHYIEARAVAETVSSVPWREIVTTGAVWALAIGKFASYFGFYTMLSWQPTYYHELGMPRDTAAYVSALPYIATIISVILFAELVHWLCENRGWSRAAARKSLSAVALLGPAACFVALCFIHDPWLGLAVNIIMFTCNGAFIPSIEVNVLDIGPRYAGSIMAFTHTISNVSGIVSNIVVGVVLEDYGHFETAFAICASVAVMGAVVYILFSKQHEIIK